MLDKNVNDLSQVDEKYHDLYAENSNGGYDLQFVDVEAKKQVDEFRNNNRNLNRQLEEMKSQMDKYSALGDDLTEDDIMSLKEARARQAAAAQDELYRELVDGEGGLNKDRLKAYADKQFDGERKELQRAIEQLKAQQEEYESKYWDERNNRQDQAKAQAIRDAIESVARVRPGAMDDVIARGRQALDFDDSDNLVVRDADGEIRYGKRGGDYMTPQEWANELVSNAGHLFDGAIGGGAQGDSSGPRLGKNGGRMVDGFSPEDLGRNFKAILNGDAQIRDIR